MSLKTNETRGAATRWLACLAGVAGGPHDVRDLLASTDPRAALALDVFVHAAAAAVAAIDDFLGRFAG